MNTCMYVDILKFVWMDVGRYICTYPCMDGYRQDCMRVSRYECEDIYIHTYRILLLAMCLPIKEYISDHRYERKIWLQMKIFVIVT